MDNNKGFYFDPKKWLGDSVIMAMDWDCKAMHLHLMAIAWQQDKKGYLLFNDQLIIKLLGNPPINDWQERIKPQILSAWKTITTDGINGEETYIYQPGLLKNLEPEQPKKTKRVSSKKKSNLQTIEENPNTGFNLENILKLNPKITILNEKPTDEEKSSIWTLGISILQQQGLPEGKARSFMAKLVKTYGDKPVASAIAQLSLKAVKPIEIQSYLIGILKKQEQTEKTKTSRGSVSL